MAVRLLCLLGSLALAAVGKYVVYWLSVGVLSSRMQSASIG